MVIQAGLPLASWFKSDTGGRWKTKQCQQLRASLWLSWMSTDLLTLPHSLYMHTFIECHTSVFEKRRIQFVTATLSLRNFATTSNKSSSSRQANVSAATCPWPIWSGVSFGSLMKFCQEGLQTPPHCGQKKRRGDSSGLCSALRGTLLCSISESRTSCQHYSLQLERAYWLRGGCANSFGKCAGLSANTTPCLGQRLHLVSCLSVSSQGHYLLLF